MLFVQHNIARFSHVSLETEYSAVRVIQFSEADLLSVYVLYIHISFSSNFLLTVAFR